jgi:hypothetical protein
MADPYAGIGVPVTTADLVRGGPPKNVPQKRTLGQDINGFMSTVNENIPGFDEITAGANTLGGMAGGVPMKQAWKDARRQQEIDQGEFLVAHPLLAALARGTGQAGSVAIPVAGEGGAVLQGGRAINMTRGAVTAGAQAGVMGLAGRGSIEDRAKQASANATNPVVLALGAAGGAVLPRKAPPMKPSTPQKTLQDAGVFLTPGVKAGGLAKNVEDLSMRAPILGPAISGARQRSNASLNRAVGNRALEPIGQTVPANIKPGHETVDYVATQLGKEYDRAASMVPALNADDIFVQAMAAIKSTASELPPDVQSQFNTIIQNRLVSRFDGRPLDGAAIREIQSEIGNISAKYGSSQDGAQQMLAEHLDEVSQALGDLIGRHSPQAQAIIAKANNGYRNYVVLRTAAAKSNKDGVFTPGQLSTAVRTSDKSVGKGNVAKGKATMQDLSGAASQVMPDSFGNPGTANAVGLGGLGVGAVTAPAQTAGIAAGLTAAATPYWIMGRKVVDSLPANAGRAELEAAAAELKRLAASDPKVAQLQQEIALRLSRGGGLLGAQAAQGAATQ